MGGFGFAEEGIEGLHGLMILLADSPGLDRARSVDEKLVANLLKISHCTELHREVVFDSRGGL